MTITLSTTDVRTCEACWIAPVTVARCTETGRDLLCGECAEGGLPLPRRSVPPVRRLRRDDSPDRAGPAWGRATVAEPAVAGDPAGVRRRPGCMRPGLCSTSRGELKADGVGKYGSGCPAGAKSGPARSGCTWGTTPARAGPVGQVGVDRVVDGYTPARAGTTVRDLRLRPATG